MSAAVPSSTRRQAQKSERRLELIEATIDCLAKHGYELTTVAVVAEAVGMSRGIVNFHFATKDKLLLATLQHLSDEYRAHWRQALAASGPSAAERLWAMIEADFDRRICTPRKIAAWYAFWGEAKPRPTYRDINGANDQDYQDMLVALCSALSAPHGDPVKLARGLGCLLEGLWLRFLMAPREFSRGEARAVAVAHVAALFPHHFTADGVIASAEPALSEAEP